MKKEEKENLFMKLNKPILLLGFFAVMLLSVSCEKNKDDIVLLSESCEKDEEVILAVQNERYKELFLNYIIRNDYDVKIIDNGDHLIIGNPTMDMWIGIRNIIKLEIDTINNNIANVPTTRTVNGGPFVRQILTFTVENGVEIISDISSAGKLIYHPGHRDAIKTGEKQGYVEYPNIDYLTEKVNLIEAQNFYGTITKLIGDKEFFYPPFGFKVDENKTIAFGQGLYNNLFAIDTRSVTYENNVTKCYLHLTEMEKQNVGILYGLLGHGWWSYSREIREVFFPNCDDIIEGGCVIGYERYMNIYVCENCNNDRDKWMEDNWETWKKIHPW